MSEEELKELEYRGRVYPGIVEPDTLSQLVSTIRRLKAEAKIDNKVAEKFIDEILMESIEVNTEFVESHYYNVMLDETSRKRVLRGHFSLSDGGIVCIVAVVDWEVKDWACYIGACDGHLREHEALRYVAEHGNKMSEKESLFFFPELAKTNLRLRK